MQGSSSLLNGAASIGVGTYLIAVVYQGNIKGLGELLKNDTGYVDFVIALFALGAIQKYGPTSKIGSMLTAITLVAFFIKVSKNNPNFNSSLSDFAAGKATILETVNKVFGTSNVKAN